MPNCCRRCVPYIACLAFLGFIVILTVGWTGKSPSQIADHASDLAETYLPGFEEDTAGKRDNDDEYRGSIELACPAFEYGGPIPKKFTSDGDDFSPPLSWSNLPIGTHSLVVLCEDLDYPHPDQPANYTWVHWVVYDIPPTMMGLPEDIPKLDTVAEVEDGTVADLRQGVTSWGLTPAGNGRGEPAGYGYRGPEPPKGHPPHRYYFRVLALDGVIGGEFETPDQANMDSLLDVLEDDGTIVRVLGFGLLMGTYSRD